MFPRPSSTSLWAASCSVDYTHDPFQNGLLERWVAISSVSGWISLLDFRTGDHCARLVLGQDLSWGAVDGSKRFDTDDISNLGALYWSFSDDPLRLQNVDVTMRD